MKRKKFQLPDVGQILYRAEFLKNTPQPAIWYIEYVVVRLSLSPSNGLFFYRPAHPDPYYQIPTYDKHCSNYLRLSPTKEEALRRLELRARAETKRLQAKLVVSMKRHHLALKDLGRDCPECLGTGTQSREVFEALYGGGISDPCDLCNGDGKRP